MRYPAAETAEKHRRILDAASRLFRRRGFGDVSVAEIMQATGLTHGPFYNHFPSKQALMAEAIGHASAQTFGRIANAAPSEAGKAAYLEAYLSTAHRDDPGDGCLMAALASEIGREPAVKAVMTTHLKALIDKMAEHFPWGPKREARGETIRALASTVGALILARAVDDEELSQEILREAAR
ncbi:MAG: TetR family transcriptional regulator [Rhodospirillales bacterium]|nr:TetR family transcriptional regulator [Rhodospirillales bacterium]